jgi:uncharacterized protein
VSVSRRQFLVAVGGLGTGLYSWGIEPHRLEIVTRPLLVPRLPAALEGRTLAHLSDIHVGPRVDDDYVLGVFSHVCTLQPDIVVVTGDLITYHSRVFEQMERVYCGFPKGKLATLGILGNHDYGESWARFKLADRVASIATEHGITILRNEICDIAGMQVVGLDDLWAGRFDPVGALANYDRNCAAIALSHNPDTADKGGWGDFEGWILSGHTHGGQCRPPFLPPPLLPVRNRRYTQGEFALSGNRSMYISRGVGHSLRVRFNVRPEVTIFELRGV